MSRRRRDSGLSLAEIIVAATLALIGFLVALVLYQAARQAFKKGELAADQQQETRVGFDRMMRDLRLAGYNWNATGENRPGEEQIEGAWDTAIAVRADYDFEDATLAADPENVIAGTTNKATIGNDEIVAYFLAKDANGDGTLEGGATLNYYADVTSNTTATSSTYGTVAARDGVTDVVTLTNVATTQDAPPYNLYRAVLNNTRSTYNTATFVQRQLLAQNVRSLAFSYLDQSGAAIAAPGGLDAATDTRARIRKVNVTIVGMTAVPDRNYTDPTDPNTATRNYRKFSLASQVAPRNLGFKGRADQDLTPPSVPTGLALCAGHCKALLVSWNPNPTSEGISQYELKYGTSAGSLTNVLTSTSTSAYAQGLNNGATYYFAIRATDSSGNHSAWSSTVSALVQDSAYPTHTVPDWPSAAGFVGTGHGGTTGLPGKVNLAWTGVSTNEVPLSCDPGGAVLRDMSGYRLYRNTSSPFTPAPSNRIADETVISGAMTSYTDTSVVNCRTYHYYLKAVDLTACGNESSSSSANAWGAPYDAKATSVIVPAAPTGVGANRTGLTTARVSWSAVTRDVATPTPNPVTIDTYKIYRVDLPTGQDPESASYTYVATVQGRTTFDDLTCPLPEPGRKVYYKVSAVDDCPNESALSASSLLGCTFNGTLGMTPGNSPPDLDPSPKTVVITATGSDIYVSARIVIDKVGGTNDEDNTIDATGNSWTFVWTPGQGPGTYVATAYVTNSTGCQASLTRTWTVVINACDTCIQIPAANPDPSSGGTKYYRQPNNVGNSCAFEICLTEIRVRARSLCASCANPLRLLRIQYRQSGTFADELSDALCSFASPGAAVSTTQTASCTLSTANPCQATIPASTTAARLRFVFATSTPIWLGTQARDKSILEADFGLFQTSSLCSPSTILNRRLEP